MLQAIQGALAGATPGAQGDAADGGGAPTAVNPMEQFTKNLPAMLTSVTEKLAGDIKNQLGPQIEKLAENEEIKKQIDEGLITPVDGVSEVTVTEYEPTFPDEPMTPLRTIRLK